MHGLEPLADLLVVFIAGTLAVVISSALRQPAIAGYLIAGSLVGPHALGLVSDTARVSTIAELGVVLLLFSLGIEFSFQHIRSLSRAFFGLGGLQSASSLLLTTTILIAGFGKSVPSALVWGCIVSLSSTALVLKLLEERRSVKSLHGKLMIAVLLFQDLWVVPVMAMLPALASFGTTQPSISTIITPLLYGTALVLGAAIGSRYLVPVVFRLIGRTRAPELFLMTVFVFAAGLALVSGALGLSPALGAFLAGVMLADSSFRHQALADTLPLRQPFLAVFFVSMGMLIDLHFFWSEAFVVLLGAGLVISVKFVTLAFPASLLGYSSSVAAMLGLSLAQIGEFSLVVAQQAFSLGLLTSYDVQLVLSMTLVLFVITPWIFEHSPELAPRLGALDPLHLIMRRRKNSRLKRQLEADHMPSLSGHVIIVGFGHNGRVIVSLLEEMAVPCVALDLNPDIVVRGQKRGVPVVFGDGSRPEVLRAASIEHARAVVVAISDSTRTHDLVAALREMHPTIPIIARVALAQEIDAVQKAGPSEIVVAEIETASQISRKLLELLGADAKEIDERIRSFHPVKSQVQSRK